MKFWSVAAAIAVLLTPAAAVDILHATKTLPESILTSLSEPIVYVESDTGEALVLDRRKHAVFAIDKARTKIRKVLDIGVEDGRVFRPGALALGPAGLFAVSDTPQQLDRIQYFTFDGRPAGGFYMPDRRQQPIAVSPFVMSGVGALQFLAQSFLVSLPTSGALVTEVDIHGAFIRHIGELRRTGHESDPELHIALNAGMPLADPTGGFYFVFKTGVPMFRKYDANGTLLFERHIEGREIDAHVQALPTEWPKRPPGEGTHPYTRLLVRTAGVDRSGHLWVSLIVPYTYEYDARGDKIRAVQFDHDGPVAAESLFFAAGGRILVTPGCLEFSGKS